MGKANSRSLKGRRGKRAVKSQRRERQRERRRIQHMFDVGRVKA